MPQRCPQHVVQVVPFTVLVVSVQRICIPGIVHDLRHSSIQAMKPRVVYPRGIRTQKVDEAGDVGGETFGLVIQIPYEQFHQEFVQDYEVLSGLIVVSPF